MTTIDVNEREVIWAQKYRPKKIADTILPQEIKSIFEQYAKTGEIPNLLLSGSHGIGKTTLAEALLHETGCDFIKINGSTAGIDTLRYQIAGFASSVSFVSDRRKMVLIDEGDGMTAQIQAAMRSFMEEFSANCGFIITCNYKQRIIEPLRESRFTQIDVTIPSDEKAKLTVAFFRRVCEILALEGIEFDKKSVAVIVQKNFPDFRKTLNVLQKAAATGVIDESSLSGPNLDMDLNALFEMMKAKRLSDVRAWVARNADMEYSDFFADLYAAMDEKVELSSMPNFIVTLARYQYQHQFVANPEINTAAMLTEILLETTFK